MAIDFDFQKVKEDDSLLILLPAGVWLMDDHKWAAFAWEQHLQKLRHKRYSLMHIDFHWDSSDDFAHNEAAQATLAAASLDQLHCMTAANDSITWDSFIAAAVRRGLLSEVHFYCLQDDSEPLDEALLSEFSVRQVVHPSIESIVAAKPSSDVIFDLCLDVFNRADDMEYEGDLWPDADVLSFIDSMRQHIQAAEVVTISMSFGYSGTEDDTRHLAELVVPRVIEMRT